MPAIKEVLGKLKGNAKLVGEIAASQTALATGEVDVLVGGGEFVTAGLAKENPALDFSIGFDDFVLMPIVPAELYARMRQVDWRTATFGSDEVLKIDDLVIDIAGYEARIAGRRLELTHQEFELLRYLAQHRGRVFTREALLERAWGYRYAGGTRTVDIHVRRVRAKLGEQGSLIETVRNVGYKMRG